MKHSKKIITISHSYGKFGGHSRHLELAKGLSNKGFNVFWIGPEKGKSEIDDIKTVTFLKSSQLPVNIPLLSTSLRTLFSLLKYKKEVKNSTLILLSEFDLLPLFLINKILKTKKIIFMQRSDLIVKTELLLKKEFKLSMYIRLKILKFIYKKSSYLVDKIIVQTDYHAKRIRELMVQTPISTIPNNINPSWTIDNKYDVPKLTNKVNFLIVANLFYYIKGFDLLLSSIEGINQSFDFKIDIVGDGIDKLKIQDEICARGISSKFYLHGKHPNASSIMKYYDALIVPSPYDDCPNVILEGINAGIPIIASNIDAHRFLLGKEFPLLEIDSAIFANVIQSFLEKDSNFRNQYVPKNRLDVFSFDWVGLILNEIT